MSAFFITSSGTGVGKTLLTAAIAHQLKRSGAPVLALKPIISGFDAADSNSDTAYLLQAQGLAVTPSTIERISPFRFVAPLAPNVAAQREGRQLSLHAVVEHCQQEMRSSHATVLIEGVGGVMAPLTEKETVLDWVIALHVPAVLVVGSYLGGISHALTAYSALHHAGVAVAAVVVSQSMEEPMPLSETLETLRGFIPAHVPLVALPRVHALPAYEHCPALVNICNGF
jgi:dethiobiotin synthetase